MATNRGGFIIPLVLNSVERLRWLAPLEHAERWAKKNEHLSDAFVEKAVTCCLVASCLSYLGATLYPSIIITLLSIVGALRIIDITTYQARDLIRNYFNPSSTQRSLILLSFNYVEIILWFSAFYLILAYYGNLVVPKELTTLKFICVVKESIGLMVSNTSDAFDYKNSHAFAWIIVTIHSVVGIFMTVIVTARIVSILPGTGLPRNE
jgi:hypothetical protein